MDNNLVLISNILSTQEKNIEQSEYKLTFYCRCGVAETPADNISALLSSIVIVSACGSIYLQIRYLACDRRRQKSVTAIGIANICRQCAE